MRQSRFTEAQITGMIKDQEAGMPTADVCCRHGLSPASFYKFKAKYGGMNVSDTHRLKSLEDENANRSVTGWPVPCLADGGFGISHVVQLTSSICKMNPSGLVRQNLFAKKKLPLRNSKRNLFDASLVESNICILPIAQWGRLSF